VGGKDRLAAGPGLVAEASQPVESVSLGPFADVSDAQAAHYSGVLQGPALFEQEQGAATAGDPNGAGAGALPALDLGSVGWGQDDAQSGLAAAHGDTGS
jgi:hypothetical protein